jgi:sugar phosphate isomerase/epimerase
MFQLGAITDELSPDIERALDLAAELGLKQIELHTALGRTVEEWDDEQVTWLQAALNQRGLSVCCISSTVFLRCHLAADPIPIPSLPGFRSIEGSYKRHLTALERCLEIAQRFCAPVVRIFGFWRAGPTTAEIYTEASHKLSEAAQMAAFMGVRLALENCPHTYFDWGRRAAKLVAKVDSPFLGMLWDPCSSLRSGDPDYLAHSSEISRCLLHIHAKDIVMDSQLKRGRKYVPVLQGQVNWTEIFFQLKRSGYDGVVCLETHHNGPDGTRASAAKASFAGLLQVYRETFHELEGAS